MHKEHISALMDGEALNSSVLRHLERDQSLQQTWESYHLIRDVMRGDTGKVIHLDISARVMAAINNAPLPHPSSTDNLQPLVTQSQPVASQWRQMPWWHKLQAGLSQMGQVAVAAGVALVVIVGVQHYGHHADSTPGEPENPVLYTLPMMGQASQVSLGAPSPGLASSAQQQIQEQHRRLNALLQDYELQRRLYADQLKSVPTGTLPGNTSATTSGSAENPTVIAGDAPAGNPSQ